MDTVEWGSVEPARRRLPALRYTIPRAGALALAAAGFGALLAAELLPWGTVHLPASDANTVRPTRSPLTEGAGLTLDTINSADVLVYHLGAVVLLGAIGFGLAGTVSRRRAAMGAAVGVAAGLTIVIVSLHRSASHFFDRINGDYAYGGPSLDPENSPTVLTGPGGYLAFVAVGLLIASAVTAGIWHRGWWQGRPAERTEAAEPVSAPDPGQDRELIVTALEPLDERYFARPDTR
jgi:hypothetical protein